MEEKCREKSDYDRTSRSYVMLKFSSFSAMALTVAIILYFSPNPDHSLLTCDRPCDDIDWPMICRVKLSIEVFSRKNRNYQTCSINSTNQSKNNQYLEIEDSCQELVMANSQIPAPPIHVCQNDVLVVDVVNKMPEQSFTMHWRGQPNDELPFMDGVPMVTQCPIASYTTFQYRFRASKPGTHFYHAFSDSKLYTALFGALIVRKPEKSEPHQKLYDVDDREHVILISEFDDRLLINGKNLSQYGSDINVFNVIKGKRHRFRIAYTRGNRGCPIKITIDGHILKVISLDGNPIKALDVQSVVINKGERLDFVFEALKIFDIYYLRIEQKCDGHMFEGFALLTYTEEREEEVVEKNSKPVNEKSVSLDTTFCSENVETICLMGMHSLHEMPVETQNTEADFVLYLTLTSKTRHYSNGVSSAYQINNLTFTYPSSPLLTQLRNVPLNSVCDELNIPEKCNGEHVCECVHVEYIPLGSITDLILINRAEDEDEIVLHMHGRQFYVTGHRQFNVMPPTSKLKSLHEANALFQRNLKDPVMKDTIRIPKFSIVALRLHANSPGFWILHDEKSQGWTRGLDIVFQVGDLADMISVPANFPVCGNYRGPDFFLI